MPPLQPPRLLPLRRSTYAAPAVRPAAPPPAPQGILRTLLARLPSPVRGRSMVSLIPFLTIGVLVLLALHLVRLAVDLTQAPAAPSRAVPASPWTVTRTPEAAATMPEVRRNIPVAAHNLQFGDAASRHTLVLFTDPACLPCREQVDAWLRPLASAGVPVRLVVKYWPSHPGDITGGLMLELARRQGVGEAYWRALARAQPSEHDTDVTHLSDARLFELMETQGQSLIALRVRLTDEATSLADTVAQDIDLGERLHLPPPPVLALNGYVLDNHPLQPARLTTYLQRAARNEPLSNRADGYFAP